MHRVTVLMCEPRIVAAFAQFDINGDGFVPMSEISTVLANTGCAPRTFATETLAANLGWRCGQGVLNLTPTSRHAHDGCMAGGGCM